MLDMAMLSPTYTPLTQYFEKPLDYRREVPQDALLFSSRRPAILKYEPRLVRLARLLTTLPWHVSGWQREAEKLEISMAEGVSFKKGWRNVPTTVYLELDGRGQDMQVYHLNFKLRARYEGLRWLMYNHRVFSFIVFTTAFWAGEVIFAVLAWALWSARSGEQKPAGDVKKESGDSESAIKAEPDTEDVETDDVDLSDTPRTFPTYGRQAPLHYVPKAKSEGAEVRVKVEPVPLPLPVGAEGDDESEIPISVQSYRGGRSDSGIGTSFSEAGTSREGVQRRRSKGRGD
jgi:seipin